MDNTIQIVSIIFSFVFGVLFSLITSFNYKFLFSKKKVFSTIFTSIYVLIMSLIYFLIIKKINDGVINIYFLSFICLGFIIGFIHFKKYVNRLKKCLKSVKLVKKIDKMLFKKD